MGKRAIADETLRQLFAHSGNCCAFEGCHLPIFEDDGTLTGECCHIEAFSPKGPRYNCHQSDEERNGYDNLVLLCARHHKVIDKNPTYYKVSIIKEMKRIHERQFYAKQLEATDRMIHQLQTDSEQYWRGLKDAEELDKSGMKIEMGKLDFDALRKEIEQEYKKLNEAIEIISNSYDNLQLDLKQECEKCGVDYSLFDTIPIYDNSLQNRDWELVKLLLPNCMEKLKMRYYQLCVMMFERIAKSEQKEEDMKLLEIYKKKFGKAFQKAYYAD